MLLVLRLLFEVEFLSLRCFFVEERFDAHPASFGTEVTAQSVSACEAPPTAPLGAALQRAFADEFLLARVQAFVAFAVVLAREGFAADCADEWAFVGVRAQMGAEVVGAGEAFGAEVALECCWVLLDTAVFRIGRGRAVGFGEVQDVVALIGGVARAATTISLSC